VVGVAPFGLFHDLRWLLVYHSSWTMFVLEWFVLLFLRAWLDTALTRLAWPDGVSMPALREQLRRTSGFLSLQALVLLPFAALLFGMAVTSLSWLFFVAVPVLVLVGVLVHHGAVDAAWMRNAPNRRSVQALLGSFAVLTLAGALIAVAPEWLQPVLAGLAGAGMGLLRLRMVDALAGREVAPRRWPFAVVGLTGVFALVIVGTTLGFVVATAVESARTPVAEVSRDASGPPVLVVKGFNSKWEGITRQWVRGRFRIARFSYAGLDGDDEPLPYDRFHTHASVRALVREMREQVRALARATGDDVSIVAESEGALIAQAYLAATPNAPVHALVLLSPLLEPGRVYYPRLPAEGWGVAAGTFVDGLSAALSWVGPVDVSANTPVFRSIVEEEPALGALLSCPPPGVRSFAVMPVDSGVSAPAVADVGFDHAVVPAFHGGLLGDGTTQELIGRVLRGERAAGSGFWEAVGDVVNAGAAAWQAPGLERSLERSWDHGKNAVACANVRSELRSWAD
jgi:hypothetical protein